MSSIVVAGDTSGTITIAAPAVAGSGTLTLPVATDTLAGIAATQTLTNKTLTSPVLTTPALGTVASGNISACTSSGMVMVAPALGTPASGALTNCTGVPSSALPAGSVLQVVNAFTITSPLASTTSTTLVSTNFNVSITPKRIGSSINVRFSTNLWKSNDGGGGVAIYLGTTNLQAAAQASMGNFVYGNTATDTYSTAYTEVFFTTTSLAALTFTLWFRSWTGTAIGLNQHTGMPYAVAMEIA